MNRADRPMIIGLTGSIGMGKSTVAAMFADENVPVFDADAAVHVLQGPGGELVAAIETAFPNTTGPQGVNRQQLGAAVFGDPEKLSILEGIVHPAVAALRHQFLLDHATDDIIVFDIPLLFEKGGADKVDVVVVVSATADQQRTRVLGRPGMTAKRFEDILALQMPDSEKRSRAHYVVDTNADLISTRQQVRDCIKSLRAPKT